MKIVSIALVTDFNIMSRCDRENVHNFQFVSYLGWYPLYADLNDEPVNDLLRQANIKTKNHLMAFSDYSWQDCPDTGRSTRAYIVFYQGGQLVLEHVCHGQFAHLDRK